MKTEKNKDDSLMRKGIFLGKEGKTFGPFQPDEYNRMFAEGKLSEYSWIWDSKAEAWKPIEAPPAPPSLVAQKTGFTWARCRRFVSIDSV